MNEQGHVEVYDAPSSLDSPDYIVQFKIKNGPLLRAMRMRGFTSALQFAKACHVNPSDVGLYLSLRRVPINSKTGQWRPVVLKMAKTLRLPPHSLFPEQHLELALAKSSGEAEVSAEEIKTLIAPQGEGLEDAIEREALVERVTRTLQCLSPREERVIRNRFGFAGEEKTYEQIGREMGGVTRERIRQIEARALRRLRHPARSRLLRERPITIEEIGTKRQKHFFTNLSDPRSFMTDEELLAGMSKPPPKAQRPNIRGLSRVYIEIDGLGTFPTTPPNRGDASRIPGFYFVREEDLHLLSKDQMLNLTVVGSWSGMVKLKIRHPNMTGAVAAAVRAVGAEDEPSSVE